MRNEFIMRKKSIKFIALFISMIILVIFMVGCTKSTPSTLVEIDSVIETNVAQEVGTGDIEVKKTPKYIFMFIGDGMSFPQVTSLGIYNGTVKNDFVGTQEEPTISNQPKFLDASFVDFPVIGAATTYDASKFVTDSASAATALASGVKTVHGALGMTADLKEVKSIATLLKEQLGYNVGILSNTFINDATPAAYYAHVESRKDRYKIGTDLVDSGFDFFAGGGLKQTTGPNKDQENVYELAKKAGYTIATTKEEINAVNKDTGKVFLVSPEHDIDGGMPYIIDSQEGDLTLVDFMKKGIEVMGDEKPMFMMVESGKVDWAAHANDPLTLIKEIELLDKCVGVAIEFAEAHPDETLIIVTGDHETGGLSMGFNGTEYNTYLKVLSSQKVSYITFQMDYVARYRDEKVAFSTAMQEVEELYGLIMPGTPSSETTDTPVLILNEREIEMIKVGWKASMIPYEERKPSTAEYRSRWSMYNYEPFQLTVTNVLSNKAGLGWTSTAHTALPVGVYVKGVGQEMFGGSLDNTEIALFIKELCGIK